MPGRRSLFTVKNFSPRVNGLQSPVKRPRPSQCHHEIVETTPNSHPLAPVRHTPADHAPAHPRPTTPPAHSAQRSTHTAGSPAHAASRIPAYTAQHRVPAATPARRPIGLNPTFATAKQTQSLLQTKPLTETRTHRRSQKPNARAAALPYNWANNGARSTVKSVPLSVSFPSRAGINPAREYTDPRRSFGSITQHSGTPIAR